MVWLHRRRNTNPSKNETHKSLLGSHFSSANVLIRDLNNRTAKATTDIPFTQNDVIKWMFPKNTRDKLIAAYPLAGSYSNQGVYDILSPTTADKIEINFNFENIGMLVPKDSAIKIDLIKAQPLFDVIHHLCHINGQFALVSHVLQWMDANCTPGAVKYYWPTMLALAPQCDALHGSAPKRFQQPKNIGAMLPLIRETAAIVATALLIDKDAPYVKKYIDLTLNAGTYMYPCNGGDVKIDVEQHYYNL